MIYILGGFCAAIAGVAIPLALIPRMHLGEHPDISFACRIIFQDAATCTAGAEAAGTVTAGALVLSLILAVFMARRWTPPHATRLPAPWTRTAALTIVAVVVGAHVVAQLTRPFSISRGVAITRESTFISLESLLWPVLLQLGNTQRRLRDKWLFFALVLPIVTLSPYRATVVALIFFGVALPLWEGWWGRARGRLFHAGSLRYAVISLAVFGVLAAFIYSATATRLQETGLSAGSRQLRRQTEMRLVQRLTYPLFQAHFAAVVAAHVSVPTLADEVLGRLRLRRSPDLDQFLYGLVYEQGTVGGMTTLYYGEAAAYSTSPPIIWITVAPLILAGGWLVSRRFGYETSTLVGIQIWRASLGGLVPLLPALVLQFGAMMLLFRASGQARAAA